MASYNIQYSTNEVKHTLTFRGKQFDYTMRSNEVGMIGDKPCLEQQILSEYKDLDCEKLSETNLDMIECYLEDEGEIFNILEKLEFLEK